MSTPPVPAQSAPDPNRVQHAQLDWDEDGQPLSRAFGDVYFSRANGLAETRHVFLQHNQLAQRFAQLTSSSIFTIGETGFGSGLNFLAAWQLWRDTAPEQARLHFVTTEKFPLSRADLTRALALWPELDAMAQALINQYPLYVGPGFHRLMFPHGVTLTLIIGDAATGLTQLLPAAQVSVPLVDAWFLDGFAPTKNPQMWSSQLFSAIARLSHAGTTAATFSAAGIVKQGLRSAGFAVSKVPGFGRKREMVSAKILPETHQEIASKDPSTTAEIESPPPSTPWAVVRHRPAYKTRKVIIIGGGLAGCHTAYALASRGWQVRLIERNPVLAAAGSGNPQGVVYAKLSPRQEPLAAFNLASLQFAARFYTPFWQRFQTNYPQAGSACGVLQLGYTAAEQQLHKRLQKVFGDSAELVQFVSAAQASMLAGIELEKGGLFFPSAGWINPAVLCHALIDHANIEVVSSREAVALTHHAEQQEWEITLATGDVMLSPAVVIANAVDAQAFAQTAHLPLKAIRGQVSYLPASSTSSQLKTVICSDGYIAPAIAADGESRHCIGATFNLNDQETAPRVRDHQTNLANVSQHLPALAAQWQYLDPEQLSGRVAFRCTTPDYLPVVGPAPKADDFLTDYAALRKNAKAYLPLSGSYWPGLFLNVGQGSRGLAYTPLASELLACHINAEPLPVSRELAQTLHPARFLIRSLQRNR